MTETDFKRVTEKELNSYVSEQNLRAHTVLVCEPPITIFFNPESKNVHDDFTAKIIHDYNLYTGAPKPTYWIRCKEIAKELGDV